MATASVRCPNTGTVAVGGGLEQNSLNSVSLGGGEDAAPAITPYVDITLDSSYPNQSAWGTFEGNGTTSAVTGEVMAACAS